jgi:hypothetical protein
MPYGVFDPGRSRRTISEMLDAIDKWRRRQTPLPSVSEAIRRLVELGLKAKEKRQ